MIYIEPIDRHRPQFCCGTCTRWTTQQGDAYCPVIDRIIPDQLHAVRCRAWRRETLESYAVALWAELGGYTHNAEAED